MKFTYIAAAAAFSLALTACASQPEPEQRTEPVPEPRQEYVEPAETGPVPGTSEHFEVTAGDRVFYGYDRYDLTAEARETLRRQAAWLSQYPQARVLIAGNADERGTREYNLALGARRANAAREYLVSQGVDPSRISTVSYGKERPVCQQSTEACWSLNRNATTIIQGGMAS